MRITAALLLLLSLSACGLYYHQPIRQGNVLTPDQVARLEPGMTKAQVNYLMGTALVESGFEHNRWDYVFYYRNTSARVRQSKISLYFANNKLANIDGKQEFLQASRGGRLENAQIQPPSDVTTPAAPADNKDAAATDANNKAVRNTPPATALDTLPDAAQAIPQP